ncbi:MAG TPA: TlpA disulfide reductase family protein [Terriglobales bacterium]|jgi:peroxiredoxin
MAALTVGSAAPGFSLRWFQAGQGESFTLPKQGSTVLVFFKVSCPTCQYAVPFFDRLYRNKIEGHGANVSVVAVSQDNERDTRAFVQQFHISMPIALDSNGYEASRGYGLTNVPTTFLICDGKVEFSSVGWSKQDAEEINARVANLVDGVPVPLFKPGEEVASFKAG